MKKGLLMALSLLLLLAACSGGTRSAGGENGFAIYYATRQPETNGKAIDSEYHTLPEGVEPVEAMVALLLAAPRSAELASPIPSGVSLIDWSVTKGVLNLEFSEGYGGLSGIDLTIADYCITLTLCQLDEVQSVVISVEGNLIPSRYYQALRSSDVLLSATEDDPVYATADLYFPKADGTGLGVERRDVLAGGGVTRSEALVTALMKGPEDEKLRTLIPSGATLLSAKVENGVCYVDFSAAFSADMPADEREGVLLLYSIVDTLCTLNGVDEVQLLIEGEAPESYAGIPTRTPLEPDFTLAKSN